MDSMRAILITGGTGVLGSEICRQLLKDKEPTTIYALIRAKDSNELRNRVAKLLRYAKPQNIHTAHNSLIGVRGDIRFQNLGLSKANLNLIIKNCTHILHAAGEINLGQSLSDARGIAVCGATNAVCLAKQASNFNLKSLHVVSTVGVAGDLTGAISEHPLTAPRNFRNSYEAAKAEAEEYIFGSAVSLLPIVVHRPSMIVGRSVDGAINQFHIFYSLLELYSGILTRGLVPDVSPFELDIVPVDCVAKQIAISLQATLKSGTVLHQCAGRFRRLSFLQLALFVRSELHIRGVALPPIRFEKAEQFQRCFDEVYRNISNRNLAFLPHLLRYGTTDQYFENDQTNALLTKLGCTPMPPPLTYLPAVLDYYLSDKMTRFTEPVNEIFAKMDQVV